MSLPMERGHSLLGTSDDSAVELSTGPTTTPGSSPFFVASRPDAAFEARLSNLCDAASTSDGSSDSGVRELPEILHPDTAADVAVRNICFIGAGYVGGPTAAVIAFHNPSVRVTVLDRDARRVRQWNSKHLPIHEPGLSDVVRVARDGADAHVVQERSTESPLENEPFVSERTVPERQPNLFFSTDSAKHIAEADIIFIGVNTPTKTFGIGAGRATDMTAVEGATRDIAQYAKAGAILVEKSTVPCRTSRLIHDILRETRPGVRFQVLSNPEFLSEGTAIKDLMNPDRVLIGCSHTVPGHRAAACLARVYTAWVPASRIVTTNVYSSELSKLVANAMLAQRISSINSISAICERTGADVNEIAHSIGLDPRIGPQFLKAGLGFGGSCFKKDISSLIYLAESLNLPEVGDYWRQVLVMNDFQRSRFARMVINRLNGTLVRKKVTLFGYAFKKNTGDTRESPAIDVIRDLLEERPGSIAIFDPWCSSADIKREIEIHCGANSLHPHGPVEIFTDPYDASLDTHAILIMTDWDMFSNKPRMTGQAKNSRLVQQSQQLSNRLPIHIRPAPAVPYTASDLLKNPRSHTPAQQPTSRFRPEPVCAVDCSECTQSSTVNPASATSGLPAEQRLDWVRVAYRLREPRLVFDGRGVLNGSEMAKLGVRVEALGKAGAGSGLGR